MADYLSFALDRIAAKTLPCHWIVTPDGDQGYEWCPTCGYYMVRNLRRRDKRRREDYILDGGWRTSHDTTPICHNCGALLDGAMTEYCAEEEIAYYREYGLSDRPDIDALYLSEIIGAMGWDYGGKEHEDRDFILSLAQQLLPAAPTAGGGDAE